MKMYLLNKIKIESYGGYKMNPVGTVDLECRVKEQKTNVKCIVLDHPNCIPILGLKTCTNLKLIKRINKVNVNYSIELEDFIKKNEEVFDGIPSTFPDIMKIKLTEGVVPITNPSRRVPLTVKNRLGETLKLLCN